MYCKEQAEMDVELQATCSALGYLEGSEYVKEPDCLGKINTEDLN